MFNRTVLDTSKVILFLKAEDARDRKKVCLLLENEDEFISYWIAVKRVCGLYDKRRE